MNRTKIEWVKNPDGTPGFTWNPITGCLNHTDGLCKGGGFPCYAYRLANGRLKQRYLNNHIWNTAQPGTYHGYPNLDPFYPRFWPERLFEPYQGNRYSEKTDLVYGKPKGIFVCDMGELFGDWLPEEWQEQIFYIIKKSPQHRFYLLTKQPQNLVKFSPFPDNCWVGVTACNFDMMDEALVALGEIEARVKYVSIEPFLGEIPEPHYTFRPEVDWFIIGAQTKPYKPPKIEWVREIVEAADKAGIPVFLKDNLKPQIVDRWGIDDMYNLLNHAKTLKTKVLELRQEMPKQ